MTELIQFVENARRLIIELKEFLIALLSLWFVCRPVFYLCVRGTTGEKCRLTARYYFATNPSYRVLVKRGEDFPKGIEPPHFVDGIWEIDVAMRSWVAGRKIARASRRKRRAEGRR